MSVLTRIARPQRLDVVTRHTWRGYEEPVRVHVDGDRAYVFALDGKRVHLLYEADVAELELVGRAYRLTTAEGEVWSLDKAGFG